MACLLMCVMCDYCGMHDDGIDHGLLRLLCCGGLVNLKFGNMMIGLSLRGNGHDVFQLTSCLLHQIKLAVMILYYILRRYYMYLATCCAIATA